MKNIMLFLGQHFGYLFLKKMIKSYRGRMAVVSYRDMSDVYYGYKSAIDLCKENKIPYLDTTRPGTSVVNFCKQCDPSLIVCGYYAKILPLEVQKLACDGAYNIHPGKLPYYRGPFPTAWALLNNEREFGITIHQMDNHIDTGPIVFQEIYPIDFQETGFELYTRSMKLSADFLNRSMPAIIDHSFIPIKQEGMGSYYGKIPSHVQINWKMKSIDIKNIVRVHAKPYFPAYNLIKNKIFLINRCDVVTDEFVTLQGPGVVLDILNDGSLLISCFDGVIKVLEYEVLPLGRPYDMITRGMRLK